MKKKRRQQQQIRNYNYVCFFLLRHSISSIFGAVAAEFIFTLVVGTIAAAVVAIFGVWCFFLELDDLINRNYRVIVSPFFTFFVRVS